MEKNNKIILAVPIMVLAILAFVFVAIIVNGKKSNTSLPTSQKDKVVSQLESDEESIIKNITGKITAVSAENLNITNSAGGEKMILIIPQQGASFISQEKKIEPANLPKDRLVEVQYNSETNEVISAVAK